MTRHLDQSAQDVPLSDQVGGQGGDELRLTLEQERHVVTVPWKVRIAGVDDSMCYGRCSCGYVFEAWSNPQRDGSFRWMPTICDMADNDEWLADAIAAHASLRARLLRESAENRRQLGEEQ